MGEGSRPRMVEPNIDRRVLPGGPREAQGCSLCSQPLPAPLGPSWAGGLVTCEGRQVSGRCLREGQVQAGSVTAGVEGVRGA